METFRNKLKFAFYKAPIHIPCVSCRLWGKDSIGFPLRMKTLAVYFHPALLPKLLPYPSFSNTCYVIFHTCSHLRYRREKDTSIIKSCAQHCKWLYKSKPSPLLFCCMTEGVNFHRHHPRNSSSSSTGADTSNSVWMKRLTGFLWPAFFLWFSWYVVFWRRRAASFAHK